MKFAISFLPLLVLSFAAVSASADDLKLPSSLSVYREELVKAFVKGYFFSTDTQIPSENRPTYEITLTRDPNKTSDVYVYRFVRTAPDKICGGIVYQNIAGANEVADSDCN